MAEPVASGQQIVRLAAAGTALLVASSAAGALAPDGLGAAHALLSCGLFVVGTGGLLWAYLVGLSRSRAEQLSLAGLFFLAKPAAPTRIRRRMRLILGVECAAVVIAASLRPYTVVAFGILAPMYAVGLMGLWGARHGHFPPREDAERAQPA